MNPVLVSPVLEEQAESELAALAKALGHPIRVRILRLLLARDSCYCGHGFAALESAEGRGADRR
jgi:DNA-binding transcriptional ArsR family regulator